MKFLLKVYTYFVYFYSASDYISPNLVSITFVPPTPSPMVKRTTGGTVLTQQFTIQIQDDPILEEDEIFNLSFNNAQPRITFTSSPTNITIIDNDCKLHQMLSSTYYTLL